MTTADYGRDAFDFVDGLDRHTTVDGVMDDAERAFGRFGFETIIVAGLPLNSGQDFSSRVRQAMACQMVRALHATPI